MGKNVKTGGRDFAPGKSGNPKGRPKNVDLQAKADKLELTEALRQTHVKFGEKVDPRARLALQKKFAELDGKVVKELINKYSHYNRAELELIYQDPLLIARDAIAICMLLNGVYKANPSFFMMLLDRSVGKVTEKVEIQMPEPTLIRRFEGEIVELGAKLIEAEKV